MVEGPDGGLDPAAWQCAVRPVSDPEGGTVDTVVVLDADGAEIAQVPDPGDEFNFPSGLAANVAAAGGIVVAGVSLPLRGR